MSVPYMIQTGGLLPVNGGMVVPWPTGPGPDPDPDPEPPVSWQAAIDTQDIREVALWYEMHAGHDGINPDDPNDTPLAIEDLGGTGANVDSEYDGQVIEGLLVRRIRLRHNNVTVRRCRFVTDGTYALQWYPTYGTEFTGCVVEFCTIASPMSDTAPAMMRGALTDEVALTFRYNDVSGVSTGGRFANRIVAEYNFFHDFLNPPGGHASGIRFMGSNGLARRNLVTHATSSLMGFYLDQSEMWDVTYEENILGGRIDMGDRIISPNSNASYTHYMGPASAFNETTQNLRVLNNWYYGQPLSSEGPQHSSPQYGLMAGGIQWGTQGNFRSGNRALQDFVIQPGHPQNEEIWLAGQLLRINDDL